MLHLRSIIVPVFDGRRHLPLFWESLQRNVGEGDEIIIVDDGSPVPPDKLTPPFGNIPIQRLRNPVNQGFAASVNRGIETASGAEVFLVNCDLVLPDDCLDSLSRTLASDASIGVVGATLLYPQSGDVQHDGMAFTRSTHVFLHQHATPAELTEGPADRQAIAFALCVFPRQALEDVGPLDDAYFNGYEDLDYSFRLRVAGYRVVIDRTIAYHWERQSGALRSVMRRENIARLWKSWGERIEPDLFAYLARAWCDVVSCNDRLRDAQLTVVNLSRGSAATEMIETVVSSGARIEDIWQWPQRSHDDYALWLPLLLPIDAARHPRPFVYLVDQLPQLDENQYWFNLRRRFVGAEILVDHNANVRITA